MHSHYCPDCSRGFTSQRALSAHVWQKHRPEGVRCSKCNIELINSNWPLSKRKTRNRICTKCLAAVNAPANKRHRDLHRNEIRLRNKTRAREVKDKARQLLGGCCQLCGTTNNLHFAHVKYHRKKRASSHQVATDVFRYPDDFLLLCEDCHRHPEPYLKQLIEQRSASSLRLVS